MMSLRVLMIVDSTGVKPSLATTVEQVRFLASACDRVVVVHPSLEGGRLTPVLSTMFDTNAS